MKSKVAFAIGVAALIVLYAMTGAVPALGNPPTTQPRYIKQASNHVAFEVPPDAHFYLHDVRVSAGGIVEAVHGAFSIYCENVWADKPPTGGGNYPFICATETVQSFVIDNTRRRKTNPNDDDFTNGGETGIRLMGRGGSAKIINVNMRCSTHDFYDPTGIMRGTPFVKQVFWKDIMALRDFDSVELDHDRVIGPWRLGEQKNTAKTHQVLKYLYVHDCKLTQLGSIDTSGTVLKIVYKNNLKIDNNGNVIGKWPDHTM